MEKIEFDTAITLDDEDKDVYIEAEIEFGYPSTFNPARECYDEEADDEVEIISIYDYEKKDYINLSKLSYKTLQHLEEKVLEEYYQNK